MVCERTCSCRDEMDKSSWKTVDAFDLSHSSHLWIQIILIWGKFRTTMQIKIVSKSWFCKSPLKTPNQKKMFFGNRTFVSITCMCKKQTPVSHSSTETEVFFFDAVYAWMGFMLSIFRTQWSKYFILHKIPSKDIHLIHIDYVPSNGTHSRSNVMLYVVEDNETNRDENDDYKRRAHNETCVKHTQSCFLIGCVTELILNLKIQIRCVGTKHQLADILTKSNFTRDEWNNFSFVQHQSFQLYLLR